MTTLYIIRHGESQGNLEDRFIGFSDWGLTDRGYEQARRLGEYMKGVDINAVYSSDLIRARVTAETVAKRFGLSVQLEPAFRELSFGDWEGLTYEQIVASWPDAMENFLAHPDILNIPNGESFPEVQQRAMSRLQELLREHEGQTIMIAAHGAVLRTMLTAALHMPLQYLWSIRQFNTAVNIVRYDAEGNPTVELLNSTAHLGELR